MGRHRVNIAHISESDVMKAICAHGIKKACVVLGIGYGQLKRLRDQYGIPQYLPYPLQRQLLEIIQQYPDGIALLDLKKALCHQRAMGLQITRQAIWEACEVLVRNAHISKQVTGRVATYCPYEARKDT